MSGSPYLPIQFSRLGQVDLAYESDNNNIAFGLGPCSQAIKIFGRHGSMCWASFPSQWLNQSDSSASCIWESKLDNLQAFYTEPRTNQMTQVSGLSPMQVSQVEGSAQQAPPCGAFYSGLTSPRCGR